MKGGRSLIYENVKRLCMKNKITIAELEKRCGIGNGAIGKWAKRESSPRVDTLKAIADYFGVTVDDLLKNRRTRT